MKNVHMVRESREEIHEIITPPLQHSPLELKPNRNPSFVKGIMGQWIVELLPVCKKGGTSYVKAAISVRGGGAGGRYPSNFGEIFKNQPFSGKFLPLVGQNCWQTMGFVSGRPLDFFVPYAYESGRCFLCLPRAGHLAL